MYNLRFITLFRTQINLEEEQYHILLAESKRQNRSIADLVRESVNKQFLKKREKYDIFSLLIKHAVDFKKINPKIPSDIAENHDDYLYGKKSKWAYLMQKPKKHTKNKT